MVHVVVTQTTSHESCEAPVMLNLLTVNPPAPLFVACTAANSAGTLTIPTEVLGQARFLEGAKGQVSVAAVNVMEQVLSASSARIIALASSAPFDAGAVTFEE
jgi:hypothetical protein